MLQDRGGRFSISGMAIILRANSIHRDRRVPSKGMRRGGTTLSILLSSTKSYMKIMR